MHIINLFYFFYQHNQLLKQSSQTSIKATLWETELEMHALSCKRQARTADPNYKDIAFSCMSTWSTLYSCYCS